MRDNKREIQSSHFTGEFEVEEEVAGGLNETSVEKNERRLRRTRRVKHNFMDFKVEILEFEGKLNLNDFLAWLQTVERVFEHKDILNN